MKLSSGRAFSNSSTKTLFVLHIFRGLGKVTGKFLPWNLLSNTIKLSASIRRSSCSCIILPKTSTSSGRLSHSIPGKKVRAWAKKDMMVKSRPMTFSTRGCRTLTATAAVGTLGDGAFKMVGVMTPPRRIDCRLGVRWDGGIRSFLSVARYTCSE